MISLCWLPLTAAASFAPPRSTPTTQFRDASASDVQPITVAQSDTAQPQGSPAAPAAESKAVSFVRGPWILRGIDWSVTLLALALALAGVLRLRRRGSAALSPESGPQRENSLREESVILAAAAYFLTAGVLSAAAGLLREPTPWSALAIDFGARAAGLAVCLLAAAGRFRGGIRPFLLGTGQVPTSRVIRMTAVWTVLAVGIAPLIGEATARAFEAIWPGYQPPAHPTIIRLGAEGGNILLVAALWISAALVTPVAEEIFFRGVLQTVLGNMLSRRWHAVIFASLAFGFVHFGQPFAIPALVFVGVCAGLLYERSGSLLAAVTLHAAFNLKTLVWYSLSTL